MTNKDIDLRTSPDWWLDFFPAFRPVFDGIPSKVSAAQARYFIRKLGLRRGSKFLDCPCGIGRMAIPLAKRGIRVTGIDITQSYLDELAKKAARLKLKIDLLHQDMREVDFDSQFDAAGNIWTSFGYFESDTENLLVLKRVFHALKPGGKFVLDVINRDWIIANYRPNDWFEVGGVKILEERRFDYVKSINYSAWHIISNGLESSHNTVLRMYSYHELLAMMNSVGFTDIVGYGSMKDDPITCMSQMMLIFGTKPRGK